MENVALYDLISRFNRSVLHHSMVPMDMVSGWPAVSVVGRTLAVTIPYFNRQVEQGRVALYPIYCSVTIPANQPDRILDFTVYPNQPQWQDVVYGKPCGYFKHEALNDVKTRGDYQKLCKELYGYYDLMLEAIRERKPFVQQPQMVALFTKLMEPGLYPQYLKINSKFDGNLCRL